MQGNQLRHDLNIIVGSGGNWSIPFFWGPFLRFVSGPILAIIYGFSYPAFYDLRDDPLQIIGFGVAHIALIIVGAGFVFPRWLNIFIPGPKKNDSNFKCAPNAIESAIEAHVRDSIESGESGSVPEK